MLWLNIKVIRIYLLYSDKFISVGFKTTLFFDLIRWTTTKMCVCVLIEMSDSIDVLILFCFLFCGPRHNLKSYFVVFITPRNMYKTWDADKQKAMIQITDTGRWIDYWSIKLSKRTRGQTSDGWITKKKLT